MSGETIVELNVGGVHYSASLSTLTSCEGSRLHEDFSSGGSNLPSDAKGRKFLDRDGVLFRYVLDFLRDGTLNLPEGFREKARLRKEATHFRLDGLVRLLTPGGCDPQGGKDNSEIEIIYFV